MSLFILLRGLFESVKKLFLANHKNTQEYENVTPPSLWNELPANVIGKIALKLEAADFIRMGGVCRSWDAVINLSEDTRRMLQQNSIDSQIPWLLQEHSPGEDLDLIHLYSLSEGKRYSFLKPKFMWESFCCGTSNGWLIMVDGSKYDPFMFLWNPISARILSLPPLSTIPCYIETLKRNVFDDIPVSNFIKRVQVFSVSGKTVVAAILGMLPLFGGYGQTLVLCTPEEEDTTEWTIIESGTDIEFYYDILYHNGILYVVQGIPYDHVPPGMEEECKRGMFQVRTISLAPNCDVSLGLFHAKPQVKRDVFEDDHEEELFCPPNYGDLGVIPSSQLVGWLHLAESSTLDELLLITRTSVGFGFVLPGEHIGDMVYIHNETRDFKVEVVKFEKDKSLYTLTSCTSLNNRALFVGTCGAVAYDSEPYQDCVWFLPSELHIHDPLESQDSGVFCLRDKTIKRCFPSIVPLLPSNLGWFTPKLL